MCSVITMFVLPISRIEHQCGSGDHAHLCYVYQNNVGRVHAHAGKPMVFMVLLMYFVQSGRHSVVCSYRHQLLLDRVQCG